MSEFVKFDKTPIEASTAINTDNNRPTAVSVCLRGDTPTCVYTHIALRALDLAAFELEHSALSGGKTWQKPPKIRFWTFSPFPVPILWHISC